MLNRYRCIAPLLRSVLPNLNGEVDECGNGRDGGYELTDTAEFLNRQIRRLTRTYLTNLG